MAEQNWKRKEFGTWDEAFRSLAPAVRQQSVRVAAYTQVLFMRACAEGYGRGTVSGAAEMDGQYADLAYKCGMYHQLGKALVPPEYQLWRSDFTAEEEAVYRKYTTDGRQLITSLQERTLTARERRALGSGETESVPWRMQRESCQQHMERWDGTGFPDGRHGGDISPIGHIVGLARELDRLSAETKSEQPFTEAFDALCAASGSAWDPKLIEVLRHCRDKCRSVYHKYIHYTMTLPKTIPLVDRRKERVMGLTYRPMVAQRDGAPVAYEAEPWFGGVAGQPDARESLDLVAELFQRTELTEDVCFYLLYEAADALLRIRTCKLDGIQAVLMPLPHTFWKTNHLPRFAELWDDQPVDKGQLWLAVPADYVAAAGKTAREVLSRCIRAGMTLVLDGWEPTALPLEQVQAIGFTHLRPKRELYLREDTANIISDLSRGGMTLLGGGADSADVMDWLTACGVTAMSGPMTGRSVDEDEMIRDCLLRER